jgi:hypothetical protein
MWSFWMETNLCRFLSFVYICIALWSSYQEGRVGIPLTDLTLPYFCACPKPRLGFPMSYVVFFCVRWLERCKVIVRFIWYWWNWWPSLFKLSFHNVYVCTVYQNGFFNVYKDKITVTVSLQDYYFSFFFYKTLEYLITVIEKLKSYY